MYPRRKYAPHITRLCKKKPPLCGALPTFTPGSRVYGGHEYHDVPTTSLTVLVFPTGGTHSGITEICEPDGGIKAFGGLVHFHGRAVVAPLDAQRIDFGIYI